METVKKALAELGYSKFEIGVILACIEGVKFATEPFEAVSAVVLNAAKMNARLIQIEAGIGALYGGADTLNAKPKAERKTRLVVTAAPATKAGLKKEEQADDVNLTEAPAKTKAVKKEKPSKKESAEEIAANVATLGEEASVDL